MIRVPLFIIMLALILPLSANEAEPSTYEQQLISSLEDMQQARLDQAMERTRQFVVQHPTSKLGQLLYADQLMAMAGALPEIGHSIRSDPKLKDLTFELRQRFNASQAAANPGQMPGNLIQIAHNQPYALLFDQAQSRLYVFRNQQGSPVAEADFFFSIGLQGTGKQKSGDKKTPVGVYHVTRYIDGDELPDLYGEGAFPVNYPNVWDIRMQRTGGGIWLHGTPSWTYNRAPWSSDGCMVVSNDDFKALERYIDPTLHTPVIVADQVEWIDPDQWQQQRKELLQALSRWVDDRKSNQHEDYIDHYSREEFNADGRDFRAWEGHQRWVNRNKQDVHIEYNNLAIYRYPGEHNLALMHYDQVYQSNILNIDSAKELYWRKQDDAWKIVYEGVREYANADDAQVEN
jgi:murein L,D-transpeptidase YafK